MMWRGLGPTLWRDVPFSGELINSQSDSRSLLGRIRNHKILPQLSFLNSSPTGSSGHLICFWSSERNSLSTPHPTFRRFEDTPPGIHALKGLRS